MNADTPAGWAADVVTSVREYNAWYTILAPQAFQGGRAELVADVKRVLTVTNALRTLTEREVRSGARTLSVLRMCTAPPLAIDRLVGLAGVPRALVGALEEGKATRQGAGALAAQANALAAVLRGMLDIDLFPWLTGTSAPDPTQLATATAVVADRLAGMYAAPIIRNSQESRQLGKLEAWLTLHGYRMERPTAGRDIRLMPPGTFAYRMNVSGGDGHRVNIPVDVVIQPLTPRLSRLPVLMEAKSAGDFANVNKRKKEEAEKMTKLHESLGPSVEYVLLLGGYFDENYLAYEAAAGIDFVWEHRIEDLAAVLL